MFKKYKKLNIQKESSSADQEELKAQQPYEFRQIKKSHSILSDETKRDIYNRFGNMSLDMDPRKDELLLITNTSVESVPKNGNLNSWTKFVLPTSNLFAPLSLLILNFCPFLN